MRTFEGTITELKPNQIFVFGSNTQGRHGKGNALLARQKFGAIYGQSEGLQGQSFAIITKDLTKRIHPSRSQDQILSQILMLYDFAEKNPDKEFVVCYTTEKNLNYFTPKYMAQMFSNFTIPDNISFNQEFAKLF